VSLHHVELWVASFESALPRWDWLFGRLGWARYQEWPGGTSWRPAAGGGYVVLEESPALTRDVPYDRMRAGLNHLAVAVPDRSTVDAVAATGPRHGWALLFPDRHPHAGGEQTYSAYLSDPDGYEVEVVGPEDGPPAPSHP
jgi:catechol 2,3-dioxygenase-like lactoylglutathione lyase family enzyme